MPELPEVELVARSLDKLIKKRRIITAELRRERLAPSQTAAEFAAKLKNSTVNFVHRRGKHVLFDLDSGLTLITHLRMSGRFMLLPATREFPRHAHAVFYLEDESKLVFQDQRHFGMMKIAETSELAETKELKNLAPEPFSDEFDSKYLRRKLSESKKSIKEFLLDQTKVCGLGNIYASEALFLSGINPQIAANLISDRRAAVLHGKIREVLAESIRHGSTMNADAENIDGSYYGGEYEGRWRVYDQEKKSCFKCRAEIKRIKQAGRSTYFCPKCQQT